MIYSLIDVPIESSAGRDLGGEHALITLSESTGGKSFYVEEGGLDKAFQKVSDDLRTQYLIGYYPKKPLPGQASTATRHRPPRRPRRLQHPLQGRLLLRSASQDPLRAQGLLERGVDCSPEAEAMATAARIPIEQYLRTSYEPDAEFVRGEIEERNVGEYDHNVVQWAIVDWFRRHDKEWQTRSLQEHARAWTPTPCGCPM